MCEIENIPSIPDQDERIEEITVGCYGQAKELSCIGRGYRTDVLFGQHNGDLGAVCW